MYGKYWARTKEKFDERKFVDKDYRTMPMKRGQQAMSTRWAIIQASVIMFYGYHTELEKRADSGTNASDTIHIFLPPV
jgi:hypothetical protein